MLNNIFVKDEGNTAKSNVTKGGSGKTRRDKKQHTGRSTTETRTKTGDKTTAVASNYPCWLVKSEPETRIEKGVDMKVPYRCFVN